MSFSAGLGLVLGFGRSLFQSSFWTLNYTYTKEFKGYFANDILLYATVSYLKYHSPSCVVPKLEMTCASNCTLK